MSYKEIAAFLATMSPEEEAKFLAAIDDKNRFDMLAGVWCVGCVCLCVSYIHIIYGGNFYQACHMKK
jgi:hypothetical protein